jgi:S1-C subfamily serine protease
MSFRRIVVAGFLINVVIVICIQISVRITSGADVSNQAGFIDLQSYVEDLKIKIEKAGPSIVMIVVYDAAGDEKGRGSGFFIDRKGRIMTNAAVMKDAYSTEVFSESNYYDDITILSLDEYRDLALIQVNTSNEIPLEFDSEYFIERGSRAVVMGRSQNFGKTFSDGLISDVGKVEDKVELIKIQLAPRIVNLDTAEDGPLFNMDGKVIGMTTDAISWDENFETIPWSSDDQTLNAISAGSVESFLSEPGKTKRLHPPRSKILPQLFLKRVKSIAIKVFLYLNQYGLSKILKIVFIIAIFVAVFELIYNKLKKRYGR